MEGIWKDLVGRKEVERIKEALEEIKKKRGKKRRKRRVVG